MKLTCNLRMAVSEYWHCHAPRLCLYCSAQEHNETAAISRCTSKGNFTVIITVILSKIRAFMKYRESVRELSYLSDTQLRDIGVERGAIKSVAREVAFH